MIKMNKLRIKTPVAIIGLGISGHAALNLLLASGIDHEDLATFDQKTLDKYSSLDDLIEKFRPSTLVVSPGVPLSQPELQKFSSAGGIITSEISLALQLCTTEKIIGVTGSLGKSTVVSLLQEGLSSFSKTGFVGGNLGTPLSSYALGVLQGGARADWLVLELSSYQLENCAGLHCDFSAITYLTPNHMERYSSLEDYYLFKWKLASITKSHVILNNRGGDLLKFASRAPKVLDQNGDPTAPQVVWTDQSDPLVKNLDLEDVQLLGLHNRDNLSIACRLALLAGWPPSSITAMKAFRGLPHRLENLGVHNEIIYVNDSKSTTMESVKTAVNSLRPYAGGQIHLLLGGRDKALPWEELTALELLSPIHFYFFGECRALAHRKSKLTADEFPTMQLAFQAAQAVAKPKDLILLSPGGTSLDEFKNFEARGDAFRRLVGAV
jgi:UDP-N-acetylmuramoylalanine--D-glutamate ligase